MNKDKETSASAADETAEEAAKTTLALNRLVGFNNQDLLASAQTFITSAITQPQIPSRSGSRCLTPLARSRPDNPSARRRRGDKRFADAAWKTSKPHRALMQSYLAWADAVEKIALLTRE